MDNLQNNLRMGLEIETHLQRKVCSLEKERSLLQEKFEKGISELQDCYSKHRNDVLNLLEVGNSFLKVTISRVEDQVRQIDLCCEQNLKVHKAEGLYNKECQDVHANSCTDVHSTAEGDDLSLPNITIDSTVDASQALAQALQEKVSALLLLSQEEERHLLERNIHVALKRKVEELQRNLLQVTNEKVKALMELAQLKQEYHVLQEKAYKEVRGDNLCAAVGAQKIFQERDGRLKNFLKKSYLKHWVGNIDSERNNTEAHHEGNYNRRQNNYKMDFARMKIENTALKESLENMEQLTSSVRRLRLALIKIQESATSESNNSNLSEAVDDIINEASLVQTAIGSSLPVSWSAEEELGFNVDNVVEALGVTGADSSSEKVDFVSAAGYEMVELLMFAAHAWKEYITKKKLKTTE